MIEAITGEQLTAYIYDSDGIGYPVFIVYHWYDCNGAPHVTDYNYRVISGDPDMSDEDLAYNVRECIERYQERKCDFYGATNKTKE